MGRAKAKAKAKQEDSPAKAETSQPKKWTFNTRADIFQKGAAIARSLLAGKVGRFCDAVCQVKADVPEEFHLPRVIVVGAESHGKSSLLESIVKVLAHGLQKCHDYLAGDAHRSPLQADVFPRHYTRCTRAPVHFRLQSVATVEEASITVGAQQLQTRDQIRTAVLALMDQLPSNAISDQPIHIDIKQPGMPVLELVDLPGLCANPDDLREASRKLVKKYLSQPDTMVLCVVPASEPRTTSSEAIHMIQQAGKLDKTILALTMADRVGPELRTQLIIERVLRESGELDGLDFAGVVATKCRGHGAAEDLEEAQNDEEVWFKQNLLSQLQPPHASQTDLIAKRLGVPHLIGHMEDLFNNFVHIDWRPRAENRLTAALLEVERELESLGPAPEALDPEEVWEAALERVDQDSIFEEICKQEIPVSFWYNGKYHEHGLYHLYKQLPAVDWGTKDWACLSCSLECAVLGSLKEVLSGKVHLPLLQTAYEKAFAEAEPLRLSRFTAMRVQLCAMLPEALRTAMQAGKPTTDFLVQRHLSEMCGLAGSDAAWSNLHRCVAGSIMRSFVSDFKLPMPEDLSLAEDAALASKRDKLNKRALRLRSVKQAISELDAATQTV